MSAFLKRVFDFVLFGNIYVALGTVCLVQSTIIQLRSGNHLISYSVLTFFATLFVYNFQRIFYIQKENRSLHSARRKWIFKNQFIIKLLTFIGFVGVCLSFFQNDLRIIFYLFPLLLISLAYFIPFIKLRKNPWIKLFTLTIVWTIVTSIVPILLSNSQPYTVLNFLHVCVRFTFMLAICLPFDIRDLEIDKADNISTLPHLMGENKTKWIAFAFISIYMVLITLEYIFGMFDLKIFIGLIISALINATLVLLSNSKRSEYFFVAGLDGTMIIQGVLLLISEKILF